MKWKSDANGLWSWNRHPDGLKSFSDNPPTSIDEAINRKTNMYKRSDGTIRTLRAKSRAKPYKGLQFEDENYENRKSNRGNPSKSCLLYTSPSPRDNRVSRMPSSA